MKPVKEKTQFLIQDNKEAVIRAISQTVSLVYQEECATCNELKHHCWDNGINYDSSKLIVELYRKICRARADTFGFRHISIDKWSDKTEEEKCNIRVAKLNKFKKYIQDNF